MTSRSRIIKHGLTGDGIDLKHLQGLYNKMSEMSDSIQGCYEKLCHYCSICFFVINKKLYFLDSGLRSFLFIISSKSTLEQKRFICKVLLYLSPCPHCVCRFEISKMNIVVMNVLFSFSGRKRKTILGNGQF